MSLQHRQKLGSWLALPWTPATLMIKRCPNQIADELSMSTTSLQTLLHSNNTNSLQESALNSLNMDHTKKMKKIDSSKFDISPEQKALQLELYKGLGERKKNLEQVLQDKIKELKDLCLKESEITGDLPHEYTLFMSPGERTPTIKKRVGTTFSIADLVSGKDSDVLSKLEMEYELQKQITKAKLKLSNDETLSKSVRKKHKEDYSKAHNKLKELEQRLKVARTQAGLDTGSFTSEECLLSEGSTGPPSEDSLSIGSSPSLTKSPKKSASSQQLEALDHSPLTRRRLNSTSKMTNTQKSNHRSHIFDIPSNPSSSSSLASLSQFEGYHEFTPTKALKYNRPAVSSTTNQRIPSQQMTDLDSVGSSTANSSMSSLHGYSVSNGRPLRSGSMDDVRLAGTTSHGSSGSNTMQSQTSERSSHSNGSTSRSRNYLSSNPYGSLERKALKQRRSMNRSNTENPSLPPPSSYNSYITPDPVTSVQRPPNYRAPPEYKKSPSQPELQVSAKTQPHPSYRPRSQQVATEYAQSVQKISRKMYDNSQPFQMLENPYHSHRRNMEQLGQSLADTHIAPIRIDSQPRLIPRNSNELYQTDSSSNQSSPKENAFNFFNTLNALVQNDGRSNSNPYMNIPMGASAETSRVQKLYVNEESKPFEMKDFYQYSERLRKARGIAGASPKPPDQPPQPPARISPGHSINSSRSASPYTFNQSAMPVNGSMSSSRYSPTLHHTQQPYQTMHTSYSSASLNSRPTPPRRSVGIAKDSSFTTGDVADNFSQEMLAWYQDQDPDQTSSTLV